MATGGRVLHHLKAALPDPRYTVLFVGYQAEGTRGRDLVDGAREVKIHGEFVQVNATVAKIDSMSAHADRNEIVRWLRGFAKAPKTTYLVHGEPGPQAVLEKKIEAELGWRVEIAKIQGHGGTLKSVYVPASVSSRARLRRRRRATLRRRFRRPGPPRQGARVASLPGRARGP